jgi:DUF3068 family protein
VKRRIFGAVLIGLGAVLVVLAVGLPLYVAPSAARLPNNLAACPAASQPQPSGCVKPSVAEANNATFLQISSTGLNIVTATLRSTTEVLPQAKLTADQQKAGKINTDTVIWDVYQTTERTDTHEVISASSTELALDRVSAAAVDWSGQWLDESGTKDMSVKYSGETYKFPFGTKKQDYKIYDTDLRTALPTKFTSVETIEGVETYHFVQDIPTTALTVGADDMSALLSRFAPGAKSGQVTYRNIRESWVDPVTGSYIKVRERQHKELQPDVGASQVLLDADFVYTHQTTVNSADAAKERGSLFKLAKLYAPIGLGLVGVLLLLGGLLLATQRRYEAVPQGAPWDSGLPEPRHRLRQDGTIISDDDMTTTGSPWIDPPR